MKYQFSIAPFKKYFNLKSIIPLVFIIGIVLSMLSVIIYRVTFIQWWVCLSLFLFPSFLLSPLLFKFLNKISEPPFPQFKVITWILHLVLHAFTTGSFILFLFLYINSKGSNNITKIQYLKIENTGKLGGKNPREYVTINYSGMYKKIMIDKGQNYNNTFDHILLTTSPGIFGYDMIINASISK